MTVGIIGIGNMGGAIMKGALKSGVIKANDTWIFDVSDQATQAFTAQHAVNVAKNAKELVEKSDCILLAVKPVFLSDVLEEVADVIEGKHVISIAAGWSMAMIEDKIGGSHGAKILRVMPNTPALVGAGYTAMCDNTTFDKEMITWATKLFSCLGVAQMIPERLMDAVIAVSGSSPAYVFMFIDAMADGAVKQGMPRAMAIEAAAQAVYGSAKMVLETGMHPAVLKDQVCSPAGTTIEAVEALETNHFKGAVLTAMDACAKKSASMTKQSGK